MEVATALTTNGLMLADNTTNVTTASTPWNINTSFIGNRTTDLYDDITDPQLSTTFMVVYFSVRALFSGFAVFGNILTIVAVVRFERLQTNTNFLICSLAAADMLAGTLTPLNVLHHWLSESDTFVPLCIIDKTISVIATGGNLFSILWIAIDRYLFIAHGLHYPMWVTQTRTVTVIGLTWFCLVIEFTGVFVMLNKLKIGMTCKFAVFLTDFAYSKLIVPQVGILAVLTCAFYLAIARIAKKQGSAIAALNQPYDTYEASVNRQQKKIAKMMIMVLGMYLACLIPQIIASIILRSSRTIIWLKVEKITVIIFWANTWLNPIIYAWKNENFRMSFRKLLGLKPSNAVNPDGPF